MLPFERQKREIVVKKESTTSPKYGCNPNKLPIDRLLKYGVLNLNKPEGPTSHQISGYVKQILKVKKAGHSGTLDPRVIGVLPVAFGDATKVVQALLPAGKEYLCLMHLHKQAAKKDITKVLKSFVGKIKQLPPIKSAIRRQIREKTIYYIEILEMNGNDVLFRVGCQAGTYIRKLCHDIGQKLGTGAHMAELIRTKAGPFNIDNTIILQDLVDALWYFENENNEKFLRHCIRPIEEAVIHLPKIWVDDDTVNPICHGRQVPIAGIAKLESNIKKGNLVAVLTLKYELVCLAIAKMDSDKLMEQEDGIAAKTESVFMKVETYPKKE